MQDKKNKNKSILWKPESVKFMKFVSVIYLHTLFEFSVRKYICRKKDINSKPLLKVNVMQG